MGKKPFVVRRRCCEWLGAFAFCTTLVSPLAGLAEPFVPTSDDQVLERLPISAEPFNKELRDMRAALDGAPGNLDLALKLAQIYVKIGKVESDPRYYGYAQGVLQPWWKAKEPPSNVLLLRALIRQNRHDFDGALQDLAQILLKEPGNIQAWLTRAVILKVRARYDQARLSCLPLAESKDPLLAITCLSDVDSLIGRAQESYNFLREFLRGHKPTSEEQHLWSLTVLAEIAARIGRNEEAEQFFKEALAARRQSAYLLAAYADFLLDQGRSAEVAALLADRTSVDTLLLRFALAKQQLKAEDLPDVVGKIRDRFAASRLRSENFHQGDEARFALYLLGRPQDALRLAEANWTSQREPQDARILLEAALAVRDRAAAQPVIELLTQTGMEHVQLKLLAAELEKLP
jgi:thioredoxin-like negative regulator of GroEL